MSQPIRVETLKPVDMYSERQIGYALAITAVLDRGKLVLCEKPYKL